ncbi:MAG: IclR family transcriptional regulator C-terminal domain-containing protein [Terracidiphilus sp.]
MWPFSKPTLGQLPIRLEFQTEKHSLDSETDSRRQADPAGSGSRDGILRKAGQPAFCYLTAAHVQMQSYCVGRIGDCTQRHSDRLTIASVACTLTWAGCAAIPERGYATDESEYTAEMRCVASPTCLGNDIVGSIGISAPTSRFAKSLYDDYGSKNRNVATRIGDAFSQSNHKD